MAGSTTEFELPPELVLLVLEDTVLFAAELELAPLLIGVATKLPSTTLRPLKSPGDLEL